MLSELRVLTLLLSLAFYTITPAIANPTARFFEDRCIDLSECTTEEQKKWHELQSKITSKQCLDTVINGKLIGSHAMKEPGLSNPSGTKNIYVTKRGIWNIGIWYEGTLLVCEFYPAENYK